jgi:hypothetical protein
MSANNHIVYTPPPSLSRFLASEKFVSMVTGPVGSGKSSAAMVKVLYHAGLMRKGRDGKRRSRAVVVRNTRQMLTDATIPTFMTWFPEGEAGSYMRTDTRFTLLLGDIECDVLFRGLDDASDVRRLLSLEVSFGVLDEFREISSDIFNALQARVGRYPSRANGGCVKDDGSSNAHLWGASNAPDLGSYWEDYLSNPPANAEFFRQPSARSPEADWLDQLRDGYYDDIAQGKSDDYIRVYIDNEFGRNLSGQPVYRSFNADFHVAKETLRPIQLNTTPLIIGLDFGLSPACTINQTIPDGRLLTFAELTSDGMGAVRFISDKLKPLLSTRFPGFPVICVGDPAGTQRAQSDERSVFDMFRAAGFRIIPARTNSISARIGAVETFLTRQVNGKAIHVIDPSCTTLIQGFRGKYAYKLRTNGSLDDKPEKNQYSHVHDAHQYACLHADGGQLFGHTHGSAAREIEVVRAVGWT